jgi:uncharacterized membrane protein YgcG
MHLSIATDKAMRVLIWRFEGATLGESWLLVAAFLVARQALYSTGLGLVVLYVALDVAAASVMAETYLAFQVLQRLCSTLHRIRRYGGGGGGGAGGGGMGGFGMGMGSSTLGILAEGDVEGLGGPAMPTSA